MSYTQMTDTPPDADEIERIRERHTSVEIDLENDRSSGVAKRIQDSGYQVREDYRSLNEAHEDRATLLRALDAATSERDALRNEMELVSGELEKALQVSEDPEDETRLVLRFELRSGLREYEDAGLWALLSRLAMNRDDETICDELSDEEDHIAATHCAGIHRCIGCLRKGQDIWAMSERNDALCAGVEWYRRAINDALGDLESGHAMQSKDTLIAALNPQPEQSLAQAAREHIEEMTRQLTSDNAFGDTPESDPRPDESKTTGGCNHKNLDHQRIGNIDCWACPDCSYCEVRSATQPDAEENES